MNRRSSFLRGLLLLLVIGPLQVQAVFACAMMDTVVHDDCCCGDHQAADACPDHDCGSTLESSTSCCEQSVELELDHDAAGEAVPFKPPDSGTDPSPGLLSSANVLPVPEAALAHRAFSPYLPSDESGSDTWLITRRLRI